MANTWRKANYIEDQRLQKGNIVKKASTNEASKPNDPKNQFDKRRYHDKRGIVL